MDTKCASKLRITKNHKKKLILCLLFFWQFCLRTNSLGDVNNCAILNAICPGCNCAFPQRQVGWASATPATPRAGEAYFWNHISEIKGPSCNCVFILLFVRMLVATLRFPDVFDSACIQLTCGNNKVFLLLLLISSGTEGRHCRLSLPN